MAYFVFVNDDKKVRAEGVVKRKGQPEQRRDNPNEVAECVLYSREMEKNPKISEDDLILEVYRGLGGLVKEFATEREAKEYAGELKTIRAKQARQSKE